MGFLVRFLAAIQQNILLGKESIRVKNSRLVMEVAQLLYREGLILRCSRKDESLEIVLRREGGVPLVKGVKVFLRAQKHLFHTVAEIRLLGGVGLYIISTVEGFMTHKEAILRGLGGQVFCFITV